MGNERTSEKRISSFQGIIIVFSWSKSGDDDAVDTPLPIPNREVKHCSGEGSLWQE